MSKSRKQILQDLLDLEEPDLGEVGTRPENDAVETEIIPQKNDCITKPKKQLTEKQLEALRKGQQTRDENARKRKEEAGRLAEIERKKIEEKIVKKAISIKKKEIKKQSLLDEISDDDTPIQKIKEIAEKPKPVSTEPVKLIPKINFF